MLPFKEHAIFSGRELKAVSSEVHYIQRKFQTVTTQLELRESCEMDGLASASAGR